MLNAGVESGRKAGTGPRKLATLKRASASSLLIVPPKLVLQFDRFDLQFERFFTKHVVSQEDMSLTLCPNTYSMRRDSVSIH